MFFVRPTHLPGRGPAAFYESAKHEYWEWSERARKFYWTKWGGEDRQGRKVRLPQYDWRSPAFQEEAEKIVRFWMDTGIDGMVIDAVNWYIGCTWQTSRRRMTDVIESYGNAYAQPEGAGAFREDPVAWISEGGWNSIQDYGLGIWWEDGTNLIKNAIDRAIHVRSRRRCAHITIAWSRPAAASTISRPSSTTSRGATSPSPRWRASGRSSRWSTVRIGP